MADDKAAEATPESVENKIAEVAPTNAETKEEKTPSTPVTEPMTNGSSTPESPKAELAADPAGAAPEQLAVNGLSLDEPEPAAPALPAEPVAHSEPEAPATEPAPAPEIPVKTEEALPIADKIADLIPEIPTIPELKTETESCVAVVD